ncbi:hypothetical protein H4R34_001748 [Dimargaris verticillata]|uniref:Magnesium transporter NIPA-domain-containing protein n=1 Tax=Dimargaris verticillata TaxID=2761393 RepID=A0A9W8E9Z8_9FUNG|nr:hypothetical protein H4R34_001748 [Dimargaris verticillata]
MGADRWRAIAAADVDGKPCTTFKDCVDYPHPKDSSATALNRLGEYTCINQQCIYVVTAGEQCTQPTQCSSYQYATLTNPNNTLARPASDFCAPQYCTIESFCDGAWTLSGAPSLADSTSCCGGLPTKASCGWLSDVVDTCAYNHYCDDEDVTRSSGLLRFFQAPIYARSSPVNTTLPFTRKGQCVEQDTRRLIWVGILLVLLGGTIQNIGLNMQKYALRQADQAVTTVDPGAAAPGMPTDKQLRSSVDKPAVPTSPVTSTLDNHVVPPRLIHDASNADNRQSVTDSLSTASFVSALESPIPSPRASIPVMPPVSKADLPANLNSPHHASESPPSLTSLPSSSSLPPSFKRPHWIHKLAFWNNLPFLSPIWLIGLVVFIFGNVLNFVALQFAPQSLVAPLSAVALVSNVVIAPLLNKEKLTWWDLVGIAFICGGSVVVVVFSGIVETNYRLCVLISLFERPQTIAYLCVIGAAIIMDMSYLWYHERQAKHNLAFPTEKPRHEPVPLSSPTAPSDSHVRLGARRRVPTLNPKRWFHRRTPRSPRATSPHPRSPGPTQTEHRVIPFSASAIVSENSTPKSPPLSSSAKTQARATLWSRLQSTAQTGLFSLKARTRTPLHHKSLADTPSPVSATVNPASSMYSESLSPTRHPTPTAGSVSSPSLKLAEVPSNGSGNVENNSQSCHPRPRPTFVAQYILPILYAALGALMASLTTLFAKSLINLLTVSVIDHDNQFDKPLSWIILLVTVFTAVSQVYWINMGLRKYDALLQVPIFYVIWTVLDIIGGGVYYDEFRHFDTFKYAMFALGVLIIFTGVGFLARRLKRIEQS